MLNIFRNFIPHETIKCSNRDPPWLNKEIKNALRHKNRLYKKYISGGLKQEDETNLRETSNFVSNLIADAKSSYFTNLGKRLNDPLTDPKTYWSILKRLMNRVKIPTVPPLLVNDIFVTDFKEKAGIFNSFFANQCNILDNSSNIPEINYKTNKRISTINFSSSDLSKIIKELNPNKAHGHDNISIRMIQIYGDSIICPLKLIFETAIRSSCFPDSWKKEILFLFTRRKAKTLLKTTGQFRFYQYLERYLRKLFLTAGLNIFWKIIFCLISSLGSVQEIHALRSYLPSLMRYINHLMSILLWKPEVYFLIYQKLLIKFGMKDFFSS